jgi:hypothetical protein
LCFESDYGGQAVMLFVGCSSCRSIGPLWCAGQFMPHMPLAAEPSARGPTCGFCGVMPPYFTCMRCGAVQWMYLAGTPPPQAMPPGQLVAPVVQAPQNAGEGQVKGVVSEFVHAVVKSAGDEVGQRAAAGMAGWA